LPFHEFYSGLGFPRWPGIPCPNHLATRLHVAELHPDDVAGLELFFQSGKLRALIAYVRGMRILGERMAVSIHAKHSE
jgi:hypothetical protein